MEVASLLTFSALALSMTATPGPNMFLVLHHVAGGNLIRAVLAISGICLSVFAHGILALVGLSFLINGNSLLLLALKLTGAAYIFHLGIQALRAYSKTANNSEISQSLFARSSARTHSIAFRHGFLTGVLNPYTGVFILTVAPQFMLDSNYSLPFELSLLIFTLALIKFVWFGGLALLIARLAQWVNSTAFTRTLNLTSGVAMILLSMSLVHNIFANLN